MYLGGKFCKLLITTGFITVNDVEGLYWSIFMGDIVFYGFGCSFLGGYLKFKENIFFKDVSS